MIMITGSIILLGCAGVGMINKYKILSQKLLKVFNLLSLKLSRAPFQSGKEGEKEYIC